MNLVKHVLCPQETHKLLGVLESGYFTQGSTITSSFDVSLEDFPPPLMFSSLATLFQIVLE